MSRYGLSLRDLVSLAVAADHGRCGPAGVCRVSRPSLSAGMVKIVEALGGRVFGRTSGKVPAAREGAIPVPGVTGRQWNGGGFDKGKSGGDNRTVQSGSVP